MHAIPQAPPTSRARTPLAAGRESKGGQIGRLCHGEVLPTWQGSNLEGLKTGKMAVEHAATSQPFKSTWTGKAGRPQTSDEPFTHPIGRCAIHCRKLPNATNRARTSSTPASQTSRPSRPTMAMLNWRTTMRRPVGTEHCVQRSCPSQRAGGDSNLPCWPSLPQLRPGSKGRARL